MAVFLRRSALFYTTTSLPKTNPFILATTNRKPSLFITSRRVASLPYRSEKVSPKIIENFKRIFNEKHQLEIRDDCLYKALKPLTYKQRVALPRIFDKKEEHEKASAIALVLGKIYEENPDRYYSKLDPKLWKKKQISGSLFSSENKTEFLKLIKKLEKFLSTDPEYFLEDNRIEDALKRLSVDQQIELLQMFDGEKQKEIGDVLGKMYSIPSDSIVDKANTDKEKRIIVDCIEASTSGGLQTSMPTEF